MYRYKPLSFLPQLGCREVMDWRTAEVCCSRTETTLCCTQASTGNKTKSPESMLDIYQEYIRSTA